VKGQPAVLMYHVVGTAPSDANQIERELIVDPGEFEWQMGDLAARGCRTLTLDEFWDVIEGAPLAEQALLVTFDDAYAGVDQMVTPILQRHGFSAVMFAPYEHLGANNSWDAGLKHLASLPIANHDQIRSMRSGPWEIASHGLRHVDLTSLTVDQCRKELAESRERLSALVGEPVRDLAYPYGHHNENVRKAARSAGYRMAFTAGASPYSDRMALDRRPMHGTDSRAVFRMKTARSASWLYSVAGLAPGWARSAARRLAVTATAGKP